MSCPTGLTDIVAARVRGFLVRYPKVRLQLVVTDRPVDLIEERIDVALRVRRDLTSDASLTMRTLGTSRWILVAAPRIARGLGPDIAALGAVPTLGTRDDPGEAEWRLEHRDGTIFTLRHEPRLTCGDFAALCDAAADGLGVAFLPDHACTDAVAAGRLVPVYPDWQGQPGIVHIVFTTRRVLPPAVRVLIDHLAATFPKL